MTNQEFSNVDDGEHDTMTYDIREVEPMGFGNSEAKISYRRRLESDPSFPEIADAGAEVIASGECMRQITDQDDGCMDGRLADTMLYLQGIEGEDFNEVQIDDPTHHQRAKLAGGGYITALAMKIALNGAKYTADRDLTVVAERLTSQGIYCGTHTGPHRCDSAVDCGANDRFPEIVGSAAKFSGEIRGAIAAILGHIGKVNFQDSVMTQADDAFDSANNNRENYFDGSDGLSRFKLIMNEISQAQATSGVKGKPVAVSKNLNGGHREAFVILNTVEDRTFSQADFKQKMQERFPDLPEDQLPQAFVVDIPRILVLAKTMAHGRGDEEEVFPVAMYAGLAFQFATAATLTDGSLRTFIVQ